MKKILYMMMAAALFAACDNPLEYKPANVNDELVVNGLMTVDEEWHQVYVAVSHTEYVGQVKSGELRCYVNGTQVAKTSSLVDVPDYDGGVQSRYFRFQAPFKAGDVVRIEVDADGKFSAWNEQVVPELPAVTKVDTVFVRQRSDWGEVSDCYRFDIGLRDANPEEDDFFRLDIRGYSKNIYYKDDAELGREDIDRSCQMFTEDDPILNEGHFTSDEMPFEIGATNSFGVITDNMFAGASATLRPIVSKSWFYLPGYMEGADRVEMDYSAVVKLYGLSKPSYYYFKALNMLRSGDTDLALEDVQIPDNIEGGIGFVSISNPVVYKFYLGHMSYDMTFYGGDPGLPE